MIINPTCEDTGFYSHRPWLRKSLHPAIQFSTRRRDRPSLLDVTSDIFHAVADRLLVYVEPDVIHIFVEEPPWLFSESTSPLSSAFCTPRAPPSTYIQTTQDVCRSKKLCTSGRLTRG